MTPREKIETEAAVGKALVAAGLLHHGPRYPRYQPDAPYESASPFTWGRPIIEALAADGYLLVSEAELATALPKAFPAVTIENPAAMAAAIFAALQDES